MSAVNRFLVSVPTSGGGGMPIGISNNKIREAAALRAREVEARRAAAYIKLIQQKNEKILLQFCGGAGADGTLLLGELMECLNFLKSDVFCSSIINDGLKTLVSSSRAMLIEEVTVLIQNKSKANSEKMKEFRANEKGLKKTSYLPVPFENHVWSEIYHIREMMVRFSKSELRGSRKVHGFSCKVPNVKYEINMSEKAMDKTLFNHDERDGDDEDDSDSSGNDDQDEDFGFDASKDKKKKEFEKSCKG